MLSDLFQQCQGQSSPQSNWLIPDVYKVDIGRWYENLVTASFDRLIKTHEPYNSAYKRVIYIFRSPADSLCSYYHYRSTSNRIQDKPPLDIENFYQNSISQWINHVQSYINYAESLQSVQSFDTYSLIQFISYESLHLEPETVLKRIAQFINLPVTVEQIQQAIERQKFSNVRESALNRNTSGFFKKFPAEDFFRKGQIGSSQTELSEAILEQIRTQTLETYQKAQDLYVNQYRQWRSLDVPFFS